MDTPPLWSAAARAFRFEDDQNWDSFVVRLIAHAGADRLPLYFRGLRIFGVLIGFLLPLSVFKPEFPLHAYFLQHVFVITKSVSAGFGRDSKMHQP